MRFPSHLRRSKHGIFHLRLTVPEDLRRLVGQREIRRSLNLRDAQIAQYWALALTTRYGRYFEEFWLMVRRGYDPTKFNPNDRSTWPGEKGDLKGEYKTRLNIFTGEAEIESDPNNPDDHKRGLEALQEQARITRELLQAPEVAEQLRLARERATAEKAVFEAAMRSGAQQQGEALVEKLTNALPAAMTKAKIKDITLGDAILEYEKSLAGKNPETIKDYMFSVRWFERSLGSSMPVSAITDENVLAWRDELIKHYTQVREKKQASRVAKGHTKPDPIAGLPAVSHKETSVDKIIGGAHRFMLFCHKKKFFPRDEELPTAGKTLETDAVRKDRNFHEAFIPADLRAMYAPENLLAMSKPHEFWMPLLCLFTGARIGELSQIYLDDIYRETSGHWVIAISDKSGFQRVKTKASLRIIPIHPTLLELGFMEYVEDVRVAVPESDRVFPYLRYDKTNGFGDVPSESFARYLDSLGIHDEEKTAHSFRKTSNQRLKNAAIEYSVRCQLIGHEKQGINEKVYATDITIPKMFEVLRDKLVFPEVDFTPLKYVKGRFIDILKSEMVAAIARKRNKPDTEEASGNSGGDSDATAAAAVSVQVTMTAQAKTPRSQRMANHLSAAAERQQRANPKRGRPRKGSVTESN